MDPWWNPAAEMQAIDRTHRIGTLIHKLVRWFDIRTDGWMHRWIFRWIDGCIDRYNISVFSTINNFLQLIIFYLNHIYHISHL